MVEANADGNCSTSPAASPIGNAPARPVMIIADRLNVTRRLPASAVASPLSKLSSTYWLKACRSAIASVACTSCASPVRARSASDPLSSATAKNPNVFSTTVYRATLTAGSAAGGRLKGIASWSAASRYCSSTTPMNRMVLSVANCIPPRRNCTDAAATIGSV